MALAHRRGNQATLMAMWGTHGNVPFVVEAYMRLSYKANHIALLRHTGYIVRGSMVWPGIEPNYTTWWGVDDMLEPYERTAEMVAKAVFNLV